MIQARKYVAKQYGIISHKLVNEVSKKLKEKIGKKEHKKINLGVRKDARKKGSKNYARKQARKVMVNQQAVMPEKLPGSTQETVQA